MDVDSKARKERSCYYCTSQLHYSTKHVVIEVRNCRHQNNSMISLADWLGAQKDCVLRGIDGRQVNNGCMLIDRKPEFGDNMANICSV